MPVEPIEVFDYKYFMRRLIRFSIPGIEIRIAGPNQIYIAYTMNTRTFVRSEKELER